MGGAGSHVAAAHSWQLRLNGRGLRSWVRCRPDRHLRCAARSRQVSRPLAAPAAENAPRTHQPCPTSSHTMLPVCQGATRQGACPPAMNLTLALKPTCPPHVCRAPARPPPVMIRTLAPNATHPTCDELDPWRLAPAVVKQRLHLRRGHGRGGSWLGWSSGSGARKPPPSLHPAGASCSLPLRSSTGLGHLGPIRLLQCHQGHRPKQASAAAACLHTCAPRCTCSCVHCTCKHT